MKEEALDGSRANWFDIIQFNDFSKTVKVTPEHQSKVDPKEVAIKSRNLLEEKEPC